ncbi:DUF2815 family protein [Paraclostridium sordellii]|uniref:DUF2815 family protein n=1 Tax=Paraclostridium sordellii TaxID=1505 RepID=UPI0005E32DB1|nr:DUF2815 family protein [Paeniclostridium sordellii]CEP49062.1 phage-like protein [[Clostridium] sordellii] [Paeniclostridium sordellii]
MLKTKVITGKVRLNYTNLFKPKAIEEGSEPKYSATLIIPKKDMKIVNKIALALDSATENGKPIWKDQDEEVLICVKDGDKEKIGEEAYKDSYFINASSKYKPGIVDINLNQIIDETQIYSGCYARCSINFYPYNQEGKIGIACSIENIQKLSDGEMLGRTSAAQDFSIPYEEDILI